MKIELMCSDCEVELDVIKKFVGFNKNIAVFVKPCENPKCISSKDNDTSQKRCVELEKALSNIKEILKQ